MRGSEKPQAGSSQRDGAVRCSARLCEKSEKSIFGDELSMTYKHLSTTCKSSKDFSHSLVPKYFMSLLKNLVFSAVN
jgi:hypothetical protein